VNMQFPTLSRVNKILVITFTALFLINSVVIQAAQTNLIYFLGLSAGGLLQGKFWTLVTYVFLPQGLMELIFECLIFWFFGSELEKTWGENRYCQFLGFTLLGAGIVYALIGLVFFQGTNLYMYPLSGPAGVASTMCVAYGVLFPKRTMYFFIFPLQAKWFALITVGMNLYRGFFSPGAISAWSQLAAIGVGVAWMMAVSNPELKNLLKQLFSKMGSSTDRNRSVAKKRKKGKNISHLHIVEDPGAEDDDPPPPTYH